ncbi:MAG: STAS domain-containing protein [Arhodomonas sp.]|nr:STAS domain-containing protein [Arhodomonas sp.]
MTRVNEITHSSKLISRPLPEGWAVYKLTGPLFFAAAERIFTELEATALDRYGIVLYMDGVPVLDAGGLAAFERFLERHGRGRRHSSDHRRPAISATEDGARGRRRTAAPSP